jgi:hypothetical protein
LSVANICTKNLTGSPQFHAIHIQSWKNDFRFSTPDIFPATVFPFL